MPLDKNGGQVDDTPTGSRLAPGRRAAIPHPDRRPGAGTDQGVFASDTSGANWTARDAGIEDLHAVRLAIAPGSPSTLYAGTEGASLLPLTRTP
ncbi:MAG TPA: hypothetical protein VJA16_19785 [Thermoanaerobaculia bacterium]